MKIEIMGIYKITNKINGKMYIGSSKDIFGRWKTHIEDLTLDRHHSYKLQKEWFKFSLIDFTFEIIEIVNDKELLLDIEQKWMDYYQCYEDNIGYNVSISSKECKTKLSVKIEQDKINKEKRELLKSKSPIKPIIKTPKKKEIRNKFLDSDNRIIQAIAEHDVEFLRSKINYIPTYHILKVDCFKEIYQYDFSWFFNDSDDCIIGKGGRFKVYMNIEHDKFLYRGEGKDSPQYSIRNVIELLGHFTKITDANRFIFSIFNMEYDELKSYDHDEKMRIEYIENLSKKKWRI